MTDSAASGPITPGATILAVDDVAENLGILKRILARDFDVKVAKSGGAALKIAREQPLDLILLDVVMPDMDGYQVCQRLKADPLTQDVPVIFLTARNEVEDEAYGLKLGAVDYISKPISAPIVQARVRTHLRLKRKNDLLERLASLDGLTEIPNRRALDEVLDREWRQARRSGRPLSLLMIDFDWFKPYNDHYGHSSGDECIKRVVTTLGGLLKRPQDFMGRYGGEEFVVILPETDRAGAAAMGEQCRGAVQALAAPHAGSPFGVVTLTIGAATTIVTADGHPRQLLEHADRLLYRGKQEGRNRVCAAPL